MNHVLSPSALLKTAWKLITAGSNQSEATTSDLRRATSTAYYALFHQLCRHTAMDFLPGSDEETIAEISRWFTHTGVAFAAQTVMAAKRDPKQIRKAHSHGARALLKTNEGEVPADLVELANLFVVLQKDRHSADYDGNYIPTLDRTNALLLRTDQALKSAREMWQAQESTDPEQQRLFNSYRCFLRLSMLYSGGPRQR